MSSSGKIWMKCCFSLCTHFYCSCFQYKRSFFLFSVGASTQMFHFQVFKKEKVLLRGFWAAQTIFCGIKQNLPMKFKTNYPRWSIGNSGLNTFLVDQTSIKQFLCYFHHRSSPGPVPRDKWGILAQHGKEVSVGKTSVIEFRQISLDPIFAREEMWLVSLAVSVQMLICFLVRCWGYWPGCRIYRLLCYQYQ